MGHGDVSVPPVYDEPEGAALSVAGVEPIIPGTLQVSV